MDRRRRSLLLWYWLPPLVLMLCFALTPDVLPFLPLTAGRGASAWCPQVDVATGLRFWSALTGLCYGSFAFLLFLVRCFGTGNLVLGRHSRRGICRQCGYDLRATPDRCPECGAAAS